MDACYHSERFDMATSTKKNRAAQTLGRLGGQARTSAQNAARKRNAQTAGRPGRVCTTCGEPVLGGHQDRRLDDTCGAHGWRWQRRDAPATLDTLQRELADHQHAIAQLTAEIVRRSGGGA